MNGVDRYWILFKFLLVMIPILIACFVMHGRTMKRRREEYDEKLRLNFSGVANMDAQSIAQHQDCFKAELVLTQPDHPYTSHVSVLIDGMAFRKAYDGDASARDAVSQILMHALLKARKESVT